MIITVGNVKGGVGKTTLAVNLVLARARSGAELLLVDGDEQGTAASFTELRAARLGEVGYTAVSLTGGAVRTQVRKLALNYADIVIDAGGRDTGSLRAALTVSDKVLIPVQPRSFDIWALDRMAELVAEARAVNEALAALVVLNAADPQGRDNDEARAALAEVEGLSPLPVGIVRRKAFPNAAAAGQAVFEAVPRDAKAVAELDALTAILFAS